MKKKILAVLGSGGHTAQMLLLIRRLNSNQEFEIEYAINDDDVLTGKKIDAVPYRITNPRKWSGGIRFFKLVRCIVDSIKTLRRCRPDVIISAGPGLTVPIFVIAKITGTRCIFLESWCRAYSQSKSGRYCYYLCDLFFVQWPDMKQLYPKAIYAGRLL